MMLWTTGPPDLLSLYAQTYIFWEQEEKYFKMSAEIFTQHAKS